MAAQRLKRYQMNHSLQETDYTDWLKEYFPKIFSKPFASHHEEFWQHVINIKPNEHVPAYFLILARGGGKDANAQGAVTWLGAHNKRKFCLYVCATQDLANKAVQTIAAMIENRKLAIQYPDFTSRQLSKYGHSKAWRIDMLRCANGFNVAALGLDASVRGIRLDEFRPDLIIFSDADSRKDTPEAVQKKIDTITKDILPAGSSDAAIVWIQNIMHTNSIARKIVNNDVDFLRDRIINGPHKAINDLQVELDEDNLYKIVAGSPTWTGQDLATCQKQINEWGYTNFMIESQHEVELVDGGFYADVKFKRCDRKDVPELLSICVFVDPAVTEDGDMQGIQVDGLGVDDIVYRLYSWEQNSTPAEAMKLAIMLVIKFGADTLGVETDQGGDLWRDTFEHAWQELEDAGEISKDMLQPSFVSARAGSVGSKKHRGMLQLNEYQKGRFIHVRGTHGILEKALERFPIRKPFDLHDAAFWSSYTLVKDAPATN